jgi:hypothetical protein
VRHEWTVQSVIGHLYSTSYCSRAELGDRMQAFEQEITTALFQAEPSGRLCQETTFRYTLALNP